MATTRKPKPTPAPAAALQGHDEANRRQALIRTSARLFREKGFEALYSFTTLKTVTIKHG